MRENNTVDLVVKEGLCTSCGICRGACSRNAISFEYGKERNIPIVDKSQCSNCGLCYRVCPGKGLPIMKMSDDLFSGISNIKRDPFVGYYLNTYTGHSKDDELRLHSATGGMVSQFLIYLLEKDIIDGAVVVRFNKDNPFEPEPFIARTTEDILSSKSSKYVVISMDKVAVEISKSPRQRLVVVGLPCHIQGWRQLALCNKKVRDTIVGYFAIYCSVNKTKHSIDFYNYRYKIDTADVGRFAFRDDGCMGYMKYCHTNGSTIKKIPYKHFWFGSHSFLSNPRCMLCIDQLGELADISFGDIHVEPYSSDTIGTNSIITRTRSWHDLLLKCREDGFIHLEDVDIEALNRSQIYTKTFKKGAGVKTNFLLRKMVGRSNPEYDFENVSHIGLKNIVTELLKIMMRTVGRHRSLWFIVKAFDFHKD